MHIDTHIDIAERVTERQVHILPITRWVTDPCDPDTAVRTGKGFGGASSSTLPREEFCVFWRTPRVLDPCVQGLLLSTLN